MTPQQSPVSLGGIVVAQDDEGVVVVAGRPPHRGYRRDGVGQRQALGLALHGVAAVEMHKVPPAVGQVQTGRGRFAQPQRPRPGVDQPRGAGDDVGAGIHGVQQFQFQPGDGVAQAHSKRFGRAVLVMGGGQALQRVSCRAGPRGGRR